MHKYTEKEKLELSRLYKHGKGRNFDELTDKEFKVQATNYLRELKQSKAFTKLIKNNEAVRYSMAKLQKHVAFSKVGSMNDLCLIITNLYVFRGHDE